MIFADSKLHSIVSMKEVFRAQSPGCVTKHTQHRSRNESHNGPQLEWISPMTVPCMYIKANFSISARTTSNISHPANGETQSHVMYRSRTKCDVWHKSQKSVLALNRQCFTGCQCSATSLYV